MAIKQNSNNGFVVKAYPGDAKTLLAFDLPEDQAKDLAGFTISYQTANGQGPFFIWNTLQFQNPAAHAQVAGEPPNSSVNAPFHKFRWVHIPGSAHQGLKPFRGGYRYTVTPRYFDGAGKLLALDPTKSVSVMIDVVPFRTKSLKLGFTRGFTQSQAFVHHFGLKAKLQPNGRGVVYNTAAVAGTDPNGKTYTWADAYDWLGFTARERIFEILDAVKGDASLRLDVFAYDFREPDISQALLDLAAQGRIRMILDNSKTHTGTAQKPSLEDQFATQFAAQAKGGAAIKRGAFGRFAHDKVFVVSDAAGARTVLTGSTNFAVTGVYVNSNHVLVFEDRAVAGLYGKVFQAAWDEDITNAKAFSADPLSGQAWPLTSPTVPTASVSFAPHTPAVALANLQAIAQRIIAESQTPKGNVLFAVMGLDTGGGPVLPAINALHAEQTAFSYGISDAPAGIFLYKPGNPQGVVVTGKPGPTQLPPPFDQVPDVGLGHQVHHKFVVCGFDRPQDAVVYCGSSNLTSGGEESNGDNLLAIQDQDTAIAFMIEALTLVDHFNFLDAFAKKQAPAAAGGAPAPVQAPAQKAKAAAGAGWFLDTTDAWTKPYYDPNDLHCIDRTLFG